MACVFCDQPAAAGETVFADEHAIVVVHDDWAVRGHLMIVSRRHVENPSDLPPADWLAFARLWHRTEDALLGLTGADRAIAMKLGIATPHLHVHLYPFAATATREEVFAVIDGKTRVERDPALVTEIRRILLTSTP
jgi:diadenosine tetraphosphate (Ap4A) HIT family hydrolase